MPDSKAVSRVVISVPEGVSHQHWVHGVQFMDGNFVLQQTPPTEAGGTIARSVQRAESREIVK